MPKGEGPVYRFNARVKWHANGGFTRVEWLDGGGWTEIPTELIPPDLRRIGSRFYLVMRRVSGDFKTAEELHQALANATAIERIEENSN